MLMGWLDPFSPHQMVEMQTKGLLIIAEPQPWHITWGVIQHESPWQWNPVTVASDLPNVSDALPPNLVKSRSRYRLDVMMVISLGNLTGVSAALPPMRLSNFRAIEKVSTRISQLRDFTSFTLRRPSAYGIEALSIDRSEVHVKNICSYVFVHLWLKLHVDKIKRFQVDVCENNSLVAGQICLGCVFAEMIVLMMPNLSPLATLEVVIRVTSVATSDDKVNSRYFVCDDTQVPTKRKQKILKGSPPLHLIPSYGPFNRSFMIASTWFIADILFADGLVAWQGHPAC